MLLPILAPHFMAVLVSRQTIGEKKKLKVHIHEKSVENNQVAKMDF